MQEDKNMNYNVLIAHLQSIHVMALRDRDITYRYSTMFVSIHCVIMFITVHCVTIETLIYIQFQFHFFTFFNHLILHSFS